ncbi:hypothetical protein IWT126_01120 [Secundilactobacillus silagei JCM 19001]|uniref:Uncharacterized protein n=1 Tax=Secundilactobacillus silagei JCM 19001 TaxID=1302250 RepID=A0A1Z5IH56_9LACO|nr:hypothetical protein IWT126_01120 [Secundilactobacillus silagei JCM 19001]
MAVAALLSDSAPASDKELVPDKALESVLLVTREAGVAAGLADVTLLLLASDEAGLATFVADFVVALSVLVFVELVVAVAAVVGVLAATSLPLDSLELDRKTAVVDDWSTADTVPVDSVSVSCCVSARTVFGENVASTAEKPKVNKPANTKFLPTLYIL